MTNQQPDTDDPEAWQAYWDARGMRYRRDPEISEDRQAAFTQLQQLRSDAPFREIELSRADVEWLFWNSRTNRTNGEGETESIAKKLGLESFELGFGPDPDLTGAVFINAKLDYLYYPAAKLQNASFYEGNLEFAFLVGADLRNADLRYANLKNAFLSDANLQGAMLDDADLQGANLSDAQLQGATLLRAKLRGADLRSSLSRSSY